MIFIRQLTMNGILSFSQDMQPFELQPLNVLIGPNGSGKSNVIEALELLRATPTNFAAAIRDGGGAVEWLWKGSEQEEFAKIDILSGDASSGLQTPTGRPLRYRLEFTSANNRVEVLDEAIEEAKPASGHTDAYFYYRFQRGRPVFNSKVEAQDEHSRDSLNSGRMERRLKRDDLIPDQSVLHQRKEPELYPEVTWIAQNFEQIQTFRDWNFGRYAPLRRPQPADLPENRLLPDSSNLALLLNNVEHRDPLRFNSLLKRFFPQFERMSTRTSGGTVQFYLHETGFRSAIPATRLSDGTIRFIAILATLLAPEPPPLVCIEEPELGMHPDAVILIGELLVEASQRMQLIVTTHSDALISVLSNNPEAVIACERPGMGTTLRRLDADKLSHWLNDYGLGDLWRMGELGANP
ncbi:MAG: AAA family ATPase [Albidovulum sp.]|nr:AAA family ATPase [Albidovulum sp.]